MASGGRQSERNVWLDLIRAAAIVLVLLHHAGPHFAGLVKTVAERGYFGVDLFFVLSGWLIGGQLLRKLQSGRLDVGRFWTRRWLRTLPAYYAVLLWLVARGRVLHPFSDALFLQNYLNPEDWVVTWSLCVEEHFYLLLPLVVWAVYRNRRLAIAAGVVLLLLSPALRWVAWPGLAGGGFVHYESTFYVPTHLRLDGLALGVLLAAARVHLPSLWGWLERRSLWLALCGVLLVCGTMALAGDRLGYFAAVWSFSLVSLGVALVIPAAVTARPARVLHWNGLRVPLGHVNVVHFPVGDVNSVYIRAATLLAEHAYALYLTHGAAYHLVETHAPRLGWPGMFACAFVFAFLLRALVEKPGLRLRDRKWGHTLRFSPERPGLE